MYARLDDNNIVQEIIAMNAEDFAYYFPADFRSLCAECGDKVEQGWSYTGATFLPPPAPPEPTPEELVAATIADYETRVQQRLDAFARTKTYENMLSACTYATSTVPAFQIEGQYCVEMRDATWIAAQTFLNNALAAVMAGERDIPAWEEVEAELPSLAWPEGSRP